MRSRALVLVGVLLLAGGPVVAFDSVMNHLAYQDPGVTVSLLCSAQAGPPVPACEREFVHANQLYSLRLGAPDIGRSLNGPARDDSGTRSNTGVRDAAGNMYALLSRGSDHLVLVRLPHDLTDPSTTVLLDFDVSSYPPDWQLLRPYLSGLFYDTVNGELLINAIYPAVYSGDNFQGSQGTYGIFSESAYSEVIKLSGLPTLLDIILSYQPPSTLSFNVPVHPEGLPGADSFSVFAGDVRHASDLSQAMPLQCTVPSGRAPVPGEQVNVSDPLPDPAAGDARYYLAAVNYQGQRRAGRSAINGVLQGRNAAALPGCE